MKLCVKRFFIILLALSLFFTFTLPVLASDDEYMLYNGNEFPNIDAVWPDGEKYSDACIYESDTSGNIWLYFGTFVGSSAYGFTFSPWEYYKLSNGSWVYVGRGVGSAGFNIYDMVGDVPTWTNFDVVLSNGSLLISGTEPQPVVGKPIVDSVTVSSSFPGSYYPGTEVQLSAEVSGTGIVPGTPESTVYWYVHGNTSADTYIDNDGLLTIANDETALFLDVEAISTYDSMKSDSVSVPVTYPLNLQITPAQTTLISSAKAQEIQFELLLPNGQLFDYSLLEWTTPGADGQYFRIDDSGLLEILPGAPAGTLTVKYAYQHDTGNVSTTSATVIITTQQEGIYDQLTPTPEQNDKADQMEDAIGNAADKLENNNSSLGQLTPTRPQINTNLEFDQEQMLAVSPLVTNIWSINGLGRMISIVLVIATVAYIFFGKRDG